MIANKWYCIAQTNTFDTSCSVNISFDATSVLFTASVKFGKSSINIASCTIEDGYVLSVRLRETESSWAIDLLSNVKIEPNVSIADSNEWTLNNAEAGSGSIIAIISNIDSKFNSNTGTGGGGDSYWQRVNLGSERNPIYAVVPKNFNDLPVHIVSYGEVSSAGYVPGAEGGDDSGSTVVFTPILTSGKEIAKIQIDGVEQSIYAPESYNVDLTGYATEEWVLGQGFLGNSFATSTTTTLTAHDKRIKSFEDMFEWDGENIKAKANFYSIGEVSSGGLSDTESGDGSVVAIEQILTEGTPIANVIVNGVDNIIYAPENSGVSGDYLPLSGGTITGVDSTAYIQLRLRGADYVQMSNLMFEVGEFEKGLVGYYERIGVRLQNNATQAGLAIKNDGIPIYYTENGNNTKELLHSGNIGTYNNGYIWNSNISPFDYHLNGTYIYAGGAIANNWPKDWGILINNGVGTANYKYQTFASSDGHLYWRIKYDNAIWPWQEIIHSGNIGQYITGGGTACLPLSGGAVNGEVIINNANWAKQLTINRTGAAGAAGIKFSNSVDGTLGYLAIGGSGTMLGINPIFEDAAGNSYTLIHSGGGTINGTLQVGRIKLWDNNVIDSVGTSYLHLNYYSTFPVSLCYGGGNVLIGTTTDDGANKLQIAGRVRITSPDWASYDIVRSNWGSSSVGGMDGQGAYFSHSLNGVTTYMYLKAGKGLTVHSNFVATGEVTSGSDERYKRIESYADIDIETIANAPIINFKWTDREDNQLHLGSTAQYWYNTSLSNGVIPTDDAKLWTMGYGQIALASVVSVAKKVVNHEERLQIVEKELADYKAENQILKQQLNEYRRA